MKLLLDTCTFLWLVLEPAKLSPRCVDLFTDPANPCVLSAVSAWEIAVKHELGQLVLRQPPEVFVPEQRALHGIEPLAVAEADALRVSSLPRLHRDPFDRMLICQALGLGLTILTPDAEIRRYPGVAVEW